MQHLLIVFAIIGLINLCYYLGFLTFLFSKQGKKPTGVVKPVSVLICAKNEADNLREFLPKVLSQDHPEFEIILINDASEDCTLEVIRDFENKDPRVKVVDVRLNEAFLASKKYALTLGIKKARHPYLLFMDADCVPVSDHWISEMTGHFTEKKHLVLGYGGYSVRAGSLLNKLVRFETLFTAIQYFSYAKWGIPYMGVGRNLAYTTAEFYKHKGFADHMSVPSGDDDLFVNQAATKENTAICFNPEGFTRSTPQKNIFSWFRQKRRHASTARHYKKGHRILLGLFYISQLLFWALLIYLLSTRLWLYAAGILIIRLFIQAIVFRKGAKKFEEPALFGLFPILELFLVCSQLVIFIVNLFAKPKRWK